MQLSQKQKNSITTSNSQINIWHGAVRSGKTYSSLLRFLIEIDEAPPGQMAIVCRDAFAFRRNIIPLLYQLIGDDFRYFEGKGLIELWGRQIHVIGAHDTRSEGKIRGSTFAGAYVDEASLIPESTWIVLLQRCAMGGARIFATTNPDSPAHWLKRDFLDDNPDVKAFHFTMLDNPALTEDERNYLTRQHKGIWYKRFVLGEWVLAEGAVFDFFDERLHVIDHEPGNAKFYLCGVDIGFTNPSAFTLIGYNDEISPCLWVENEYYWTNKSKGSKTDYDFVCDLYDFVQTRYNVKFIYVDPAAAGFKAELARYEIGVPVRDAENKVLDGIRTVSTFMGSGDLKIHRRCTNLIKEVQGYCWDPKHSEKGLDAPIKKSDHLLDSIRYAIYSYFGNRKSLRMTNVKPQTLGYQGLNANIQNPHYRDKNL